MALLPPLHLVEHPWLKDTEGKLPSNLLPAAVVKHIIARSEMQRIEQSLLDSENIGRNNMHHIHGDWRDQREALEAAYKDLGIETGGNIPEHDWKLVEAVLKRHSYLNGWKCMDSRCNKELSVFSMIRCAECHMIFCERCIFPHFEASGAMLKKDLTSQEKPSE